MRVVSREASYTNPWFKKRSKYLISTNHPIKLGLSRQRNNSRLKASLFLLRKHLQLNSKSLFRQTHLSIIRITLKWLISSCTKRFLLRWTASCKTCSTWIRTSKEKIWFWKLGLMKNSKSISGMKARIWSIQLIRYSEKKTVHIDKLKRLSFSSQMCKRKKTSYRLCYKKKRKSLQRPYSKSLSLRRVQWMMKAQGWNLKRKHWGASSWKYSWKRKKTISQGLIVRSKGFMKISKTLKLWTRSWRMKLRIISVTRKRAISKW